MAVWVVVVHLLWAILGSSKNSLPTNIGANLRLQVSLVQHLFLTGVTLISSVVLLSWLIAVNIHKVARVFFIIIAGWKQICQKLFHVPASFELTFDSAVSWMNRLIDQAVRQNAKQKYVLALDWPHAAEKIFEGRKKLAIISRLNQNCCGQVIRKKIHIHRQNVGPVCVHRRLLDPQTKRVCWDLQLQQKDRPPAAASLLYYFHFKNKSLMQKQICTKFFYCAEICSKS